MSCTVYSRDLIAFMDHELDSERSRVIAGHLEGCAACRREIAEFGRVVEFIACLEPIEPSAGFEDALHDAIRRERGRRSEYRPGLRDILSRFLVPRFGVAASATLAIVIFVAGMFAVRAPVDKPVDHMRLAADMELFLNMDVIEHSEALEHFDLIRLLNVLEQDMKG